MAVLRWAKEGSVAILTMDNGENRHNPVFLREMLALLDEIEDDVSVKSLVITSADPKFWSLGMDIDWFMDAVSGKMQYEVKTFLGSVYY